MSPDETEKKYRLDILSSADKKTKEAVRNKTLNILRGGESDQLDLDTGETIEIPEGKLQEVRRGIEQTLSEQGVNNALGVKSFFGRLVVYDLEDDEPDPGDKTWTTKDEWQVMNKKRKRKKRRR